MNVERSSPILILSLAVFTFIKCIIFSCIGKPQPLRDLCYRILDFDCQELFRFVRHVSLRDLFPTHEVQNTVVYAPLDRGAATMTFDEIVNLSALVQILKPKIIFEIGTFRGYATRALAHHAPSDCKVFTLDLPPEEYGKSALKQHSADYGNICIDGEHKPAIGDLYLSDPRVSKRIKQCYGSSDVFDYSPFYGMVDFFFIDGAHSYDFVRNDTAKALLCLSEKGVVVWHDLKGGFRGLLRFFKQFGRDQVLYHLSGTSLVVSWPKGRP